MMLFKLSLKNIKKSFKDYVIYFMTLILGVAIFYVFNAMDSQTAMMRLSQSTKEIVELMIYMLTGVSVVVALILGFLIVYASNFLIRRRKKEFGIYMTLGMGKREISRILLGETILIGLLSLAAGIGIGVFASQFMSILVAKMFETDMSAYTFIFSRQAAVKTVACFGIMYLIVIIFNVFTISRYKLIDLFHACRKNEKGRLKSSGLAVVLFAVSCAVLAYAYIQVAFHTQELDQQKTMLMIVLGCVGTFLMFWSLSGFLLKLLQRIGKFYHRGLNAFVLRQVNSNINTAVFSMTIICLLFFVTITVLSTGLSLNHAFRQELTRNCPVDMNLVKTMDVPGSTDDPAVAASLLTVEESMKNLDFDFSLLQDWVEITVYTDETFTWNQVFRGEMKEEVEKKFPRIRWDGCQSIVGVSEYNKLASYYGMPVCELSEGEYQVVCDFSSMERLFNRSLADNTPVTIGETTLLPRETVCADGFLLMNIQNSNLGFYLVPDSVIAEYAGTVLSREENILAANYAAEKKQEKKEIEERVKAWMNDDAVWRNMAGSGIAVDGLTKIYIYDSAVGLSSVITFIAIYLGIVFLIAGAALLALKELSESTVNKERYAILDKIGVDEKQKHQALLWQMGIFFGLPMLLAMIHAVFGILYASNLLNMYAEKDMRSSLVFTGAFLIFVYGGYFLATYMGSRRIIDEK